MFALVSRDKTDHNNTIKLWRLYNKEKIEKLKNKMSVFCIIILQAIQCTCKYKGRIINLSDFPKLQLVFQLLS